MIKDANRDLLSCREGYFVDIDDVQSLVDGCKENARFNNAIFFNAQLKAHTGKVVPGVGWALKNMKPPREDMFFGLRHIVIG